MDHMDRAVDVLAFMQVDILLVQVLVKAALVVMSKKFQLNARDYSRSGFSKTSLTSRTSV